MLGGREGGSAAPAAGVLSIVTATDTASNREQVECVTRQTLTRFAAIQATPALRSPASCPQLVGPTFLTQVKAEGAGVAFIPVRVAARNAIRTRPPRCANHQPTSRIAQAVHAPRRRRTPNSPNFGRSSWQAPWLLWRPSSRLRRVLEATQASNCPWLPSRPRANCRSACPRTRISTRHRRGRRRDSIREGRLDLQLHGVPQAVPGAVALRRGGPPLQRAQGHPAQTQGTTASASIAIIRRIATRLWITTAPRRWRRQHRVKLCAKCHGTIYRDWEQRGMHGRQNGFWKADASRRPSCAASSATTRTARSSRT